MILSKALFTIAVVIAFAFIGTAQAGTPNTFNISGKLGGADGATLLNPVDITIQIRSGDQNANCLLYEEKHEGLNVGLNQGRFSLAIGSDLFGQSSLKRTQNDPGLAMDRIFANSALIIRTDAADCPGGYTPGARDSRKVRIFVTDTVEQITEQLSPDKVLSSVPFAKTAETLQGLSPSDLVTRAEFDTLTTPTTPNSPANKDYVDTTLAGEQVDSTAPSDGQVLVWDASQNKWVASTPSAGGGGNSGASESVGSTGTTTLDASSPTVNYINYSTNGFITLPDATTLQNGHEFQFLIDGGSTTIRAFDGAIVGTVNDSGGGATATSTSTGGSSGPKVIRIILFSNATSRGNWRVFTGINDIQPYANIDVKAYADGQPGTTYFDYRRVHKIAQDHYLITYRPNLVNTTHYGRVFRFNPATSDLTLGNEFVISTDAERWSFASATGLSVGEGLVFIRRDSDDAVMYAKFTYDPTTLNTTMGTLASTGKTTDSGITAKMLTPTMGAVKYSSGGNKAFPIQINMASGTIAAGADVSIPCCGDYDFIRLGTSNNVLLTFSSGSGGAALIYNSGTNTFDAVGASHSASGRLFVLDEDNIAWIRNDTSGSTRNFIGIVSTIDSTTGSQTLGSDIALTSITSAQSIQLKKEKSAGQNYIGFHPDINNAKQPFGAFPVNWDGTNLTLGTQQTYYYHSNCEDPLNLTTRLCQTERTPAGNSYPTYELKVRKGADF